MARNPERAIKGSAARAAATKAREEKKALAGKVEGEETAKDEEATTDEGAKSEAEASFASQAAAATGQSERSVSRSLKIAKAFDEDQLEVFNQMSVSQTDMLTIAKIKDEVKRGEVVYLIASGMDVADALKEVMREAVPVRDNGTSKAEVEAKAAAKEEKRSELSDAEWFATYCGEKAAMLGDTARFKAGSLLFREIADARHVFRTKVKAALKRTAEAGTKDSFYSLVNRVISISHPKDWLICDGCKGTGSVETPGLLAKPKCNKCLGDGYLLKTEESTSGMADHGMERRNHLIKARDAAFREFSGEIRELIASSGTSRYVLARQAGISKDALSRFMQSKQGLTAATLDKLADALGLEVIVSV
jgi:hypothetical protein